MQEDDVNMKHPLNSQLFPYINAISSLTRRSHYPPTRNELLNVLINQSHYRLRYEWDSSRSRIMIMLTAVLITKMMMQNFTIPHTHTQHHTIRRSHCKSAKWSANTIKRHVKYVQVIIHYKYPWCGGGERAR